MIASWTDVEYRKWDWAVFITGILQFGLAWIIIGWAWSIWWGIRMYTEAQQRKARIEERTRRVEVVTRQNTIDSTSNNPTSIEKPEQQYSVEVRTEPIRTAEVPYWFVFFTHVLNNVNRVDNIVHTIVRARV